MRTLSKILSVVGSLAKYLPSPAVNRFNGNLAYSIFQCSSRRTMANESTVNVNGANIHYEKVGQGKHVILLVPGALGSARTDFTPQLEKLNREKFTIIGWDPRGYGKSQPPLKKFTPTFLREDADDAAALMETLGYPCYSVLGWSDGANVAAMMAAKWSGRVCKLVVWGGNSYVTPEEITIYQKIRDISLWSPAMKNPMIETYGEEGFESLWHAWVDIFVHMSKESGGNIDLYKKDLEKINCDTLIVNGDKDSMVPKFHCEELHKGIKASRLVCWDDGKHNIHIKFADRFNKLVEEFLLEEVSSNI